MAKSRGGKLVQQGGSPRGGLSLNQELCGEFQASAIACAFKKSAATLELRIRIRSFVDQKANQLLMALFACREQWRIAEVIPDSNDAPQSMARRANDDRCFIGWAEGVRLFCDLQNNRIAGAGGNYFVAFEREVEKSRILIKRWCLTRFVLHRLGAESGADLKVSGSGDEPAIQVASAVFEFGNDEVLGPSRSESDGWPDAEFKGHLPARGQLDGTVSPDG